MTIAEWLSRSKQAIQGIARERRAAAAATLAVAVAFCLGTVASKDWNFGPAEPAPASQAAAAEASAPEQVPTQAADKNAHTYVASKTGTRFYLPSCAGAKRIKPGNEVWFATEAAAKLAGYAPAAACKGL